MNTVSRTTPPKIVVTILADAGTFQDLTDRLRRDYVKQSEAPRIDLLRLPESIVQELKREYPGALVEAPREGRVLYNLGASSAATFLEKMEAEWSVQTFPLGMCRYDRAPNGDSSAPPFRIRFHSPISYALGYFAAKNGDLDPMSRKSEQFTVVVVSDDAQLVPSLADARQCGLDVRLAWFAGSISPETSHFCGVNAVPVMVIDPIMLVESHAQSSRSRDYGSSHLNRILNIARPRK